jgi:RimK family alpha-L-glutamate ligase
VASARRCRAQPDRRPADAERGRGLWIVSQLEAEGVRVLNSSSAALAAHDKLLTARLLEGAGVPHPRTARIIGNRALAVPPRFPVVCKPRFGSWGQEVELIDDLAAYRDYCAGLTLRSWWRAGAIVQELVPPAGHDLRVVVAGGRVIGAAARRPARREWRTNVARGAVSGPATPPPDAVELALRAVDVVGLDLAGVDLLPFEDGWVVLEVNAAVDFRPWYGFGSDVFSAALGALASPSAATRGAVTAA